MSAIYPCKYCRNISHFVWCKISIAECRSSRFNDPRKWIKFHNYTQLKCRKSQKIAHTHTHKYFHRQLKALCALAILVERKWEGKGLRKYFSSFWRWSLLWVFAQAIRIVCEQLSLLLQVKKSFLKQNWCEWVIKIIQSVMLDCRQGKG